MIEYPDSRLILRIYLSKFESVELRKLINAHKIIRWKLNKKRVLQKWKNYDLLNFSFA